MFVLMEFLPGGLMQYLEQSRSILAEYLVEFLVNSTISV
jgi:hypothetical protein